MLDNLNYEVNKTPDAAAAPYEDAVCSNGTVTASSNHTEYEPVVSQIS